MLYIYFENIVFNEIAKELCYCFEKYGIESKLVSEIKLDNYLDLYIIFGMNDFSSQIIPRNYIVYQLEQTTGNDESKWFRPVYIEHMKRAIQIWDYSLINYKNLKTMGLSNLEYVPLQYMETLDMFDTSIKKEKDIDVFFYGSMNERRQKIIEELQNLGLCVVSRNHVWAQERDDLIARSKIVLNVHYFESSLLETARLSYLLSNNCVVVSEVSLDPVLDKSHNEFVKFAQYDELSKTCQQLLLDPEQYNQLVKSSQNYKKLTFYEKIPFKKLSDKFNYLLNFKKKSTSENQNTRIDENQNTNQLVPNIDSSDLFEAEMEVNKDKGVILKLPKFKYDDLPFVSIVTITYNRKHLFPMAIRNWELFEYPRDKLEWIIVDDSDDGSTLSDLLPKSQQIKYYKLQTTGRLSIGQKRNFGVKNATHEIICMMDDDDYYWPFSVFSRVGLLLKYPKYNLVGVTDLDTYNTNEEFSARIRSPYVSEASMAFRKQFWVERQFPEKFNTLGEGYPFLKGRRHRVIKMPSCFNLIAMTHSSNYTTSRSYSKVKHLERKGNILSVLDLSSRLFICSLFDKSKFKTQ